MTYFLNQQTANEGFSPVVLDPRCSEIMYESGRLVPMPSPGAAGTRALRKFEENWITDVDLVSVNGNTVPTGSRIEFGRTYYLQDTLPFRLDFGSSAPLVSGRAVSNFSLRGVQRLVLGNSKECDVTLTSDVKTRLEAILTRESSDDIFIQKTFGDVRVNGKEIEGLEPLFFGDRIEVGNFIFEYRAYELAHISNSQMSQLDAANISRRVKNRNKSDRQNKELTILKDTTLQFTPERFVGVLGGSGQGKSTLMNCVAGVERATTGQVSIDGVELNDFISDNPGGVGFVPQDDIVHKDLTVWDALRYSSRLRLPSKLPDSEIERLIKFILKDLGLTEHKDKFVRDLSGGQRKRVSIASEMISSPIILFLDEPTSGLDPATEQKLMELLNEKARFHCPVVCTTHILGESHLFHEVIFVNKGKIVYRGAAGDAAKHFGVTDLLSIYKGLDESNERKREIQAIPTPEKKSLPKHPDLVKNERPPQAGVLTCSNTLLARQWKLLLADRMNLWLLLSQPILLGLLIGWGVDSPVQRVFLLILASLWFGCSNASQTIVKELEILKREHKAGLGLLTYLNSKFVFWAAVTIVQSMLFLTIMEGANLAFNIDRAGLEEITTGYESNGATSLNKLAGAISWYFDVATSPESYPQGAALNFLGVALTAKLGGVALSALVGCALGLGISASVKSIVPAVLCVPIIILPQIPLSGSMIPVPEMNSEFLAVSRCSPCFQLKRISDAGLIYGDETPAMLSFTDEPVFVDRFKEKGKDKYKLNSKNGSWVNLLTDFEDLGEHKSKPIPPPPQGIGELTKTNLATWLNEQGIVLPTVEIRDDVHFAEGTIFSIENYSDEDLNFFSFVKAVLAICSWIAVGLVISFLMLKRNTQ